MTWTSIYLTCLLVGFFLSVVSLLAGSVHLHLPHMHFGHFHLGHVHGGSTGPSWFNIGTLAAFLAWFGGTGYLLLHSGVGVALAAGVSAMSGVGGASVVFWFLAKVLMKHEKPMDQADYDMIGVLGKLSMPIRTGGIGELVYSQGGTRRVAGARAESGAAIAKGAEVVVTRYEKGIAYVREFDELTGDTLRSA